MSRMLKVLIYPCKDLRQKSKRIKAAEIKTKKIQQLISDLDKTMKEKDGIGLSAPQVGQQLKLAVINTQEGTLVLINPRILKKSWKKELSEEGCLSLPEIFGLVKRPIKIRVSALDKTSKRIRFTAEGLFARVIAHEVDHLKGILFIDKAEEITKGRGKLEEMKKQK